MKLVSQNRSLGLEKPGASERVEVFLDSPPRGGSEFSACWLTSLPDPRMLPGLLSADQVWSSPQLLQGLEDMGLPPSRLKPVEGLEEGEAAAAELKALPYSMVWRGQFGRNSSLSWLNSEIIAGIEQSGQRVLLQNPGSPPSELYLPSVSQSWPPDFLPAAQGPAVIFSPWEYWFCPERWVSEGPRVANRWFTTSEYARQGMVASGLNPDWIEVVPCGVDGSAFSPQGDKLSLPRSEGKLVFLFVGGTIYRKGVDILQAAWQRAFSAEDPVMLLIKDFGSSTHYRGQNSLSELERWSRTPGMAQVEVISDQLSAQQMPLLYRAADVGVFPYRGEGFCMPALEAMSCGLPIIFPDQGPTREYCSEGGWALDASPQRMEEPRDVKLVEPPLVHQIGVESLAEAMRDALDPDKRKLKARAARQEAEAMSWQKASLDAQESLAVVAAEKPVHLIQAARPEGRRILVAASPDWQSDSFSQPLQEFVGSLPPDAPLSLCLLGSPDKAEPLIACLGEGDMIDISLVEADSFEELALGCDFVLLLDQQPSAMIGRPQADAEALLGMVEAKIGS